MITQLVEMAEARFEPWPNIGETRCAPTGEPYVTLCSGGIKEEGAVVPMMCGCASEAYLEWIAAFAEYGRGKSGRLFWRQKPFLDTDTQEKWCLVRARLLISNKEPIEAAA